MTVIPVVGTDILCYCWGGYFITTVTVQRMYALHYLLPFVVAGGLVVHLALLHAMGSGTASTVPGSTMDAESFLLYYYKDVYVIGLLVLLVIAIVLSFPDTLHHPDNFCYVDRYVTPKHIVPEWYFLPFYSMLRACSIKVLGVILLGTAVLVYIVLLLVLAETKYSRGLHQGVETGSHVALLVLLGILGQCAPVYPYVEDRKSVV